jgi:hypothetical protein
MLPDFTVCDLAMRGKQAQGAALVRVHEAAVACNIGTEDRGETPLDSGGSFDHLRTASLGQSQPYAGTAL